MYGFEFSLCFSSTCQPVFLFPPRDHLSPSQLVCVHTEDSRSPAASSLLCCSEGEDEKTLPTSLLLCNEVYKGSARTLNEFYVCLLLLNYNRRAGGTSCAESSSVSVTTDSAAVILFSSFILIMCHQERYLCKVTFKAITTTSDYTD